MGGGVWRYILGGWVVVGGLFLLVGLGEWWWAKEYFA